MGRIPESVMVYKNLQIDSFLLCRKEPVGLQLRICIARLFVAGKCVDLVKCATIIEDLSLITYSSEEAS